MQDLSLVTRGVEGVSSEWLLASMSPPRSIRALVSGGEKQPPFFILLAAGSDIIYSPHVMATHPPTLCEKDKTQTFKAQRGTYQFKTKNQQFAMMKL